MRDQKLRLAKKDSWSRENKVDVLKEAEVHLENNHVAHERKTRVNSSSYFCFQQLSCLDADLIYP